MRILKMRVVAMAAVLLLAACSADKGQGAPGEAQAMRTYEVPAARLESVQHALREVLGPDTGTVSNSNGRLLVLAPASTQESIARAIEELSAQPAGEAPASTAPVRLRFWLLEGHATATPPDPRLDILRPALDEASRGLGLQGFTLQGFSDVLASPGKLFQSRSGSLDINGLATRSGAGVTLSARIDLPQRNELPGQLQTEAALESGQFLVLGSTAAADGRMKLIVAQAELAAGAD